MRTTITIDDDIMRVERGVARAESRSIGAGISDLVRKGLRASSKVRTRNGFPVFSVPPDAHPITLDDVRKQENEI